MDALAARKSGTSAVQILNKNNRLLISGLSFRTRALFWLTNLPYWALAARLATLPSPLVGPPWSPLTNLSVCLVALRRPQDHLVEPVDQIMSTLARLSHWPTQ